MFNTLGERISYCRNLLCLTRTDMVTQMDQSLSLPTLARWELNTVTPSMKKIEILTSFFIKHGINVSCEWIKNGNGFPPLSIDLEKFDTAKFDELAYSTLVSIRNKVKDFYFAQVGSNFLKPLISFGDYIGGIVESNKKLIDNKLCFLCLGNAVMAGIYNFEKDIISNISGDSQVLNNTTKIGEIQWIIRRP